MSEQNHTETWLPMVGYEAFYSVSSLGRVRSERNGIVGRGKLKRNGYRVQKLWAHGRWKSKFVHRLVMAAFVGQPRPEQTQVNHKNGIRDDNRLENLEYCTPLENTRHAIEVLGTWPNGEKSQRSRLKDADIRRIRELRAEGVPVRKIGRMFGVCHVQIIRICRHDQWSHI